MNGAFPFSSTENQAAMPSRVVRIVFNDFSRAYNMAYFRGDYHPVGTRHLSYSMGKK